ncbi:pilus assembly protein TadB, partial [Bifidobacteriaceae bacterium NR015]
RAEDLRADVAAMPKATIKLLTALPILALFAGELLGGHPILMLIT